ncbi:transcription initiation factor TFIID subunit 8-like [Durio zibethinus]|uniref:Transcription initiation factor TFIID subunit 8 n=1 Tax=Durio zibethinus TaxID=66656 RepID=A0A6P5ZEG4_DURZI|nr:transcription initiation factor TFIID subunit 8-like [Durio zibethinus]XP_022750736.1 transcription initiation factor TFIID subunit 8-like [Durio zibethinus]
MNDGSLENRKEHEKSQKQSKSSKFRRKSDDFALAIRKVAVAQVCESVGFQSFQHSALETLSDIIVRYIYSIGKTASLNANLAGRAEANVFDVIQGLEELGSGLGFAGSSDVDRCVANSGIVRDIVHYVGHVDDIPFAYDVPRFPVVKEWKGMGSFWEKGEEPLGEHIPSWLPAFPDPETYATRSSAGNEMMSVSNGEKTELARVERKVEQSLLNLQQRFAHNGNEGGSSRDGGDNGRARKASLSNPYLAAPLLFGEKEVEVSPVLLPAKLLNEVALRNHVPENCVVGNHVSLLETFAPAIEAIKSGLCNSDNEQKKVLYNQRPLVHFKIGIGKKSLGMAPDFNSSKKDPGKIASWFGNDNEKDDQKRRAEKILKESRESSQERAQL